MQKEKHPEMHPVIFRDSGAGVDFKSFSTRTSEVTEDIDGTTYQIISIEVSSASHPFYTGKDTIIDTAGRVEKFKKRAQQAKKSN